MAKKYLRECTLCGDLIYTKVRDSVPICGFCKERPEKNNVSGLIQNKSNKKLTHNK